MASRETKVMVSKCTLRNQRCIKDPGSDHEKRISPIHGTSQLGAATVLGQNFARRPKPKEGVGLSEGALRHAADRGFAGSSFLFNAGGFRFQSFGFSAMT